MIFLLDKKVLLYWKFTAAVLFAAVFSALWMLPKVTLTAKTLISVGVLAVFFVWWFVYLPQRFKNEKISVENGRIFYKKGVVIKREYIYPNARLVYVQTVRLPLAYCFGLVSVVVRGVGHSLILPLMTLNK